MPCEEGHVHDWPRKGILYVQRCERICLFCEEEGAARKVWNSSAWFLRRHIRGVHARDYPDLKVGDRHYAFDEDTFGHKDNSGASASTPRKRASPRKATATPAKRTRRSKKDETPESEVSIAFDTESEDDIANDDGDDKSEAGSALNPIVNDTSVPFTPTQPLRALCSELTTHNIDSNTDSNTDSNVDSDIESNTDKVQANTTVSHPVIKDNIPGACATSNTVTKTPIHPPEETEEMATTRHIAVFRDKVGFMDALDDLYDQGIRWGLTPHEMAIVTAEHTDRILSGTRQQLPLILPPQLAQPFPTLEQYAGIGPTLEYPIAPPNTGVNTAYPSPTYDNNNDIFFNPANAILNNIIQGRHDGNLTHISGLTNSLYGDTTSLRDAALAQVLQGEVTADTLADLSGNYVPGPIGYVSEITDNLEGNDSVGMDPINDWHLEGSLPSDELPGAEEEVASVDFDGLVDFEGASSVAASDESGEE
ncbi:hypothetical protein C1H76_7306 [Elsinoe australis]|uniref:Uncharacterized protein n=1 Tax=Elsinoe australis TaxID=40998 RepID=A0A4U7AVL8_9PEZI|nr:hypothetical protein C1H76_7306 [Elsinoe australis]